MPQIIPLGEIESWRDREIGVSSWAQIEQGTIDAFAQLTGDHQWVHVDVPRAAREIGGTIAHGYLVLSLIPRFVYEVVEFTGRTYGLNYGLDRVRFINKVPAGARLRGRVRLVSAESRSGGKLVKLAIAIEIEGEDRPACSAETLTLIFPGPA